MLGIIPWVLLCAWKQILITNIAIRNHFLLHSDIFINEILTIFFL